MDFQSLWFQALLKIIHYSKYAHIYPVEYYNDRTVFEFIEKNVHNFTFFNDVQKFIYLLCSENTANLNAIGKFITNYICNKKLV